MSEQQFACLVFSTLALTAGGNLVNDILDWPLDQLNKPHKTFIPHPVSERAAWVLYWALFLAGFVTSLYVAVALHTMHLLPIFPAAWAWLYAYSKWLKKMPVWGNLTVSVFCSAVALLPLLFEQHSVREFGFENSRFNTIYLFSIFAFIATMLRELIKDIEDMDGDAQYGCRTLPIVIGPRRAKWVCIFWGLLLNVALLTWIWVSPKSILATGYLLFIFSISLFINFLIIKSFHKQDFSKISTALKVLMALGLLTVIL